MPDIEVVREALNLLESETAYQGVAGDARIALDSLEAELAQARERSDAWQERAESWSIELREAREERDAAVRAIREAVNTLGPDYFGGELEGLVAEGNEVLRVLRDALTGETEPTRYDPMWAVQPKETE